jgi:hypothetical protein
VTQAFKLYATGEYTLGTLTAELNHLGLRMPEAKSLPERPIQLQHVHRILHNRYYIGVITYSGVEYEGEHQPLIDDETFELAQVILTSRNLNKQKSKKHPHPLKGNLFCARCGRRMGISSPTNRYGTTYAYFYCLGRQKDTSSCAQPYVNVQELEEAVADYFRRVHVPEARLRMLRDEIAKAFDGKHADAEAEIAAQESRIVKLKQRAKRNKEAYFAEALSLEEFKAEQDLTNSEIAAAEKIITKWTVTAESIKASLGEALSIMVDPYRLFMEAPDAMRLLLTQAIFEKLWVMDTEVVGSELTDAYHELLTTEAQLAIEGQQESDSALDELSLVPAPRTYYRQRNGGGGDLDGEDSLAGLAGRLWVERPRGALPLDSQNPASPEVRRGSDVLHLVGESGMEPLTG